MIEIKIVGNRVNSFYVRGLSVHLSAIKVLSQCIRVALSAFIKEKVCALAAREFVRREDEFGTDASLVSFTLSYSHKRDASKALLYTRNLVLYYF